MLTFVDWQVGDHFHRLVDDCDPRKNTFVD